MKGTLTINHRISYKPRASTRPASQIPGLWEAQIKMRPRICQTSLINGLENYNTIHWTRQLQQKKLMIQIMTKRNRKSRLLWKNLLMHSAEEKNKNKNAALWEKC